MTTPDIQVPIAGVYNYVDHNNDNKQLSGLVDLGQIKTLGKERIVSNQICCLTSEMNEIELKLLNVLGLGSVLRRKENEINSLKGKIRYLKDQLKKQ